MSTDELVDRVALAIRVAIASMDPAVLVSMASEEGPTDLTPFYVIAESVFTGLDKEVIELKRERYGYQWHIRECEQIAGKALGYPWYKDDQKNFPGATESDGVCIGEHVGDTIVAELAKRYEEAKEKIVALEGTIQIVLGDLKRVIRDAERDCAISKKKNASL